MKVLVLSNLYPPDFLGGYELGCEQIVDALRSRGHEVLVLTGAPRAPVVGGEPPHVLRRLRLTDEWNPNAMGTHPAYFRAREVTSRVVDSYNVYTLLDVLGSFAPEVILLSNLVGLGGLGLLACLGFLGVPWVWHLGDYAPLELCSERSGLVPGLARQFARHVRGSFIAVSRRVIDGNSVGGLALNGRVELVPYWITGERPPVRSRHYQDGPIRILSVGRLDRQKGTDLLIDAAALLRNEGVELFTIDLFGQASEPEFAATIRRLGLDQHVRVRGPRPHAEVSRLYDDYDILAFPTRDREPFGLVALEAASRGCVPLISRECGAAEWLVHGAHCLKAERTAGSFAAAVRAVADGRVGLGPIARRGAEAAWRDFHLDAVLPKIERALERAAREGRGRRPRPGAAAEAYRLAKLAEQLTHRLAEDAIPA